MTLILFEWVCQFVSLFWSGLWNVGSLYFIDYLFVKLTTSFSQPVPTYKQISFSVPPPLSPSRNGSTQYRSAPHHLSYNPAENAILICSVRI